MHRKLQEKHSLQNWARDFTCSGLSLCCVTTTLVFLTLVVNNYKGVSDYSSVTSRVVTLKGERRMIEEIEIPELPSTLPGLCMVVTSLSLFAHL